jgi:predicted dehydrogenase
MARSIIIGMGIGQLYKTVLENLGHEIVTVDTDTSKGATYDNLDKAILSEKPFDTAHVCTPNFTHFDIASKIAPHSKIVFIEKPGVADSNSWRQLLDSFDQTRFMMVKNNMWRAKIPELQYIAELAVKVNFNWINEDRVPNPGTWFTTKKLAFGGVSRDLTPHLLSLFISCNPYWKDYSLSSTTEKAKRWNLESLSRTDYGTVNKDGVYDVDDYCKLTYGEKWTLTANWKSDVADRRNIEFTMKDESVVVFQLGLCPEDAYQRMIKDAVDNIDNDDFWQIQRDQDIWIHKQIEKI